MCFSVYSRFPHSLHIFSLSVIQYLNDGFSLPSRNLATVCSFVLLSRSDVRYSCFTYDSPSHCFNSLANVDSLILLHLSSFCVSLTIDSSSLNISSSFSILLPASSPDHPLLGTKLSLSFSHFSFFLPFFIHAQHSLPMLPISLFLNFSSDFSALVAAFDSTLSFPVSLNLIFLVSFSIPFCYSIPTPPSHTSSRCSPRHPKISFFSSSGSQIFFLRCFIVFLKLVCPFFLMLLSAPHLHYCISFYSLGTEII